MKQRGLLGLVTFSEKRSDVLLQLRDSPKTLREIKDRLEVTSSQIIPQLRKLEKNNLIYQDGKKYNLTEIGEVITSSFAQLSKIIEIFEEDLDFWNEHNIGAIPEEFLARIPELGDYELIESNSVEVFRPHKKFMQNLEESEWIRGVSPIFHPRYPEFLLEMAKSGCDVKLAVSKDVFEKIESNHKGELKSGLECENAELLIYDDDVKVAFTVTDSFLSLGLFGKDGLYDTSHDLVSDDASAVRFGKDLFNYYEERSKEVGLRNL